ncbi:hypothetical protein BH686_26280 [Rhodococcus erythropolis]|uniref:helix-turn-helix domain-containing protein n=1 Tax=Rhodococcus erythropolis TaxID=1833 RepID=UPI000A02614C|nr:helix-turn-helix transcriptional regulator [Rhodococcus erythropolis]ORI17407.1 hypothetical protein BH686_26280 [Rhodococcus erythropolis]
MHQSESGSQEHETETETSVDTQFGDMMRVARQKLRWSQRQLAEALQKAGLKIDPSAITRIENGQREPKLREAVAISDILDIKLDDLVFSESADFRRNLVVINHSLVTSRQLLLQGLIAVDKALAGVTPAVNDEMLEVSEHGDAKGVLRRQVEMFFEMVDQDLQKEGRNYAYLYGGVGDQVKQAMVDALTHKILRPAPKASTNDAAEA